MFFSEMTTNKENGKENPRQKTGKKKKTFQHILYSEPQVVVYVFMAA